MKKAETERAEFWSIVLDGLWAEGVAVFFMYLPYWILGALFFVAILTPINYISQDYTALVPGFTATTHNDYIPWADALLALALAYFFLSCFLNQRPVTRTFVPHLGGIFVMTVVLAILLGILLVGLFISSSLEAADLPDGLKYALVLAADLLTFAVLLRLVLAVPLALHRVKSPFKVSWQISTGNVWRLAWNMLAIALLVTFPVMVLINIIGTVVGRLHIRPTAMPVSLALAVLFSLITVVALGMFWALIYACCRALYGEYVVAHLPADRRAARRS
jgi:hypothetical protein